MSKDIKQELQTIIGKLFHQTDPISASIEENSSIITVPTIDLPNDYLVGRTITLSPTEPVAPLASGTSGESGTSSPTTPTPLTTFISEGVYNINANHTTDNVCYITVDFIFTETADCLALIEDDRDLDSVISSKISYLDTGTPSQFIKNRIPTYNNYFIQLELLVENMMNFVENYIHKEVLHTVVGNINTLLAKSPSTEPLENIENVIYDYLDEITHNVDNINNVFSENEQYFERLRVTMADVKIAGEKTDNKPNEEYYNSRNQDSKDRIDGLYQAYQTSGREGYSDKMAIELTNIKIQRNQ